ncbi:glycerophosphodiester phosphodiesterase family protein [Actinosynnema sp. NPDC050436]|uniref:glycerophosphodiester phosphodiesterase family protein n=1 Tax=Actinosynnema sp. NPDC050436 TaxID=3155659 RepID=UPI0033D79ADD
MRALTGAVTVVLAGALVAPGIAGAQGRRTFDLQAHRGGIGLTVESTLAAFGKALETGVTTLELDVQITRDGREVITHDRRTNPARCSDTAPATPDDPAFPYVGKYVKDLTFAQVRTLDCGSRAHPGFPGQATSPGARMPTLAELFALARRYRAWDVRFNIETKVEAAAPHETAPREQFVEVTAREIRRSGFSRNVTIQSFDWGTLMLWRTKEPHLPLVALTQPEFLRPGSPWLGGLRLEDFGGSVVRAVKSFGASALSPVHGNPQNGKIGDPDYVPFTTKALVQEAHRHHLKVVPWTVDDPATVHKLVDDGVDGIITDYPDRVRTVLRDRGLPLPRTYRKC